jgi:hypothetical protein
MSRCVKCIALGRTPKAEEAGAHLREATGEPRKPGLRLAQPGEARHDMTSFTMFRCPEDGCADPWWRRVGEDGSFIEWDFAGDEPGP